MSNPVADAVCRARANSPFLATLLGRNSALADQLNEGHFPVGPAGVAVEGLIDTALRNARNDIALWVAIGDLAGLLDLSCVMRTLTEFADRALEMAISGAIAERTPGADTTGFCAIALGKQGSCELNYSSDIDPIFLYDPDTIRCRTDEIPSDAAVRIARRVVETLQVRNRDGYVLRVDLRLRPSPEATPIAIPINGAISYYESQALTWERAAFIRARPAAGDVALGATFLNAISPFIWRHALDYGTMREVLALSTRARGHYSKGQEFGPGYDLKRGRGGIREIEFFTQIHQLIHGGRDPNLRSPATRDALAALAKSGRIPLGEARVLSEAHTVLRTAEHRAQMVDDRQTHQLPAGDALQNIAELHGITDGQAFLDWIEPHVRKTAEIFNGLRNDEEDPLPSDDDALESVLEQAGLDDVGAAIRRIRTWRTGRYPALRSHAAQVALEATLPILIDALRGASDTQAALNRLDTLLSRLPSAVNFFRLIEARPALGALLVAILVHAEPLAAILGRRPVLLDAMIDATVLADIGNVEMLVHEMNRVEPTADLQFRLDHVRRIVAEKRFALGTQIVAGSVDPMRVGRGYAAVAEAAVEVLAGATVAEFEAAHGRVPDSELAILALGRLGGGVMTHASDLDLVFVFSGDFNAESQGVKPLGATVYYNRLAQRIIAALSVPTAQGPLYDLDMRLRPMGVQGPIAVSLASFAQYQRRDAWIWEHMALCQGRVVFGSDQVRSDLTQILQQTLAGDRKERDVVADARAMRAEIAKHKPPKGPLDAKLLPGALVDLEFIVHSAQLIYGKGLEADLGTAIAGLVEAEILSLQMIEAHGFMTRLLIVTRLLAPDCQPPAIATRDLIADAMDAEDWAAMIARFDAIRHEVARELDRIWG